MSAKPKGAEPTAAFLDHATLGPDVDTAVLDDLVDATHYECSAVGEAPGPEAICNRSGGRRAQACREAVPIALHEECAGLHARTSITSL
jgi:hypothetical protein